MSEIKRVDYAKVQDVDQNILSKPISEGKLLFADGSILDAIYFQDNQEKIVAYMNFKPDTKDSTAVVTENFTNEAYRKMGLQEQLNKKLIRLLREKGYKKIIGHIYMDNSKSFLNGLKMKDPDADGVLKAECSQIDELPLGPIKPKYLDITIDLHTTVTSNEDLIQKIIQLQERLTEFRFGPSIAKLRSSY